MAQSNGDEFRDRLNDSLDEFLEQYRQGYDTSREQGLNLEYCTFDSIVGFLDNIEELSKTDRKQYELEARVKLLEELTRKAKRYNQHDPVVDLDIWAVPLAIIEEKLKAEREAL